MDVYTATQVTLGVVAGLALLSGAQAIRRRAVSPAYRRPVLMFSTWWAALGAAWLVWALDTVVVEGAVGQGGALALVDYAFILVYFALILMAFASLFYYLLTLYVGNESLANVVWLLYGGITVVLLAVFASVNAPTSFVVTGIQDAVFGEYQSLVDGLRLLLIVPVLVAALSLFAVYRTLNTPEQRYRVLLIAGSLAFYLLMPLMFPSNPGIQPEDPAGWAREVLNKVGLLVAIVTLHLAYRPPRKVRERLRASEGPS